MVPSNAAWGYGSRVRFPVPHLKFSQEERAVLIALSTLYLPISIVRGAGIGTAVLWKLTRLGGILSLGTTDSPGGGGPGQSPISTIPPLSLEATGASLTQLGKPGVPASSSKRGSRPRRRCPYYWTGSKWRLGMSPWLYGETANRCVKRAGHARRHRKD